MVVVLGLVLLNQIIFVTVCALLFGFNGERVIGDKRKRRFLMPFLGFGTQNPVWYRWFTLGFLNPVGVYGCAFSSYSFHGFGIMNPSW